MVDVAPAQATIEAGQKTFAEGAQAAQANWTQAAQAGNSAFKDAAEKSLGALNELNSQGKKNLEAVVASVTAATRAAESLGAQAMSYAKSSAEGQVEAAKALSSAKSVQEAVELQTSFAKSAMETYVAEMNRATEIVASAMKASLQPLNERATAMMESMQSVR